MEQKNLRITEFDPFGGGDVNPSWEAVSRLPEQVGEYRIHKLAIPTVFGENRPGADSRHRGTVMP